MTDNNLPSEKNSTIFLDGLKINVYQKVQIWKLLQEDPECPTRFLIEKLTIIQVQINVRVRQINRLRKAWGFSRSKGRPGNTASFDETETNDEIVVIEPTVPCVGLHIFDQFIEEFGLFDIVISLLMQAIRNYMDNRPSEDFPLLHHKADTLKCRFKSLLYAPLLEIGKLTEFDIKENALGSVIGRSYQSSTLNQHLGHLEKIDAAGALIPALIPEDAGKLCYIDGHMIPFWTSTSMHKGKITMLGRIMPGSNAVVAHNDRGEAIYFDYYPPDIRLPGVILEYCKNIVSLSGINLFIIDREVNSIAMAYEFENAGFGLISMLDKNEYKSLSDWDTEILGELEDGSKVHGGYRNNREGDIRYFVIVEKSDRLLPYWGTPKAKELLDPIQWPIVYSQRNELQENSFKRMKCHGALNVNFGIKKIIVADRHHGRKKEKLEERLESINAKVETKEQKVKDQDVKVKESIEKGHGKRLEQRQEGLLKKQSELEETEQKKKDITEKIDNLGPAQERADRDSRKQRIMTFRTLFLENALQLFLLLLLEKMDQKISMECLISLFIKRSGMMTKTRDFVRYGFSTAGLSKSYKEKLEKISGGINALNISSKGRLIQVGLFEIPT